METSKEEKMFQKQRLIAFVLLVALLAGCVPGAISTGGIQAVQSSLSRESAPQADLADKQELAAGNNAFALDLYQAVKGESENVFFSPYSISLALAMTYAGANGETERQMAETLHFTLPEDRLHPAFNALDQELASRKDSGGQGADGKGFRFNIVNDLWGQKDYEFQAVFLDTLAKNYGAGLRLLDFSSQPEAARQNINKYIAEKTEDRIKDLIPEGAIDPLTRLVLTNAIYFNAAWQNPFEKSLTKDAPFTKLDGATVNVPMMELPSYENMPYADGEGYIAVALPYENPSLSMLILLPDEGFFEAFEGSLDAARLERLIGEMQFTSVRVKMPKFKIEGQFELGNTLKGLGMIDAFEPDLADFSGMNGKRDLYIGSVIHKSFVNVDEQGTEAAAATAVIMETTSAPMEMIDLTIDRPFLFLIRDVTTNTTLFVGRVAAP